MMIFHAFGGKISKNLNRSVLTFFMPDKPVELIKIVSLSSFSESEFSELGRIKAYT